MSVIVTRDTMIFVRAAVLLGQFLKIRLHSTCLASEQTADVCINKMFLDSLVSNSSLFLSTTGGAALEMLGDRGQAAPHQIAGGTDSSSNNATALRAAAVS